MKLSVNARIQFLLLYKLSPRQTEREIEPNGEEDVMYQSTVSTGDNSLVQIRNGKLRQMCWLRKLEGSSLR